MPTHAELVTPERLLFGGEAEFVVLRAEGGEIMFLPHHCDFVAAVDICVVRIPLAGGDGGGPEVRAAVAGGFVHVADNRVTVLASVAELADEIDVDRARRALADAEAAELEEGPAPGELPEATAHGEQPLAAGPLEPTMAALLQPDRADVRARRARARLEAAGVLGPGAPTAAAVH